MANNGRWRSFLLDTTDSLDHFSSDCCRCISAMALGAPQVKSLIALSVEFTLAHPILLTTAVEFTLSQLVTTNSLSHSLEGLSVKQVRKQSSFTPER